MIKWKSHIKLLAVFFFLLGWTAIVVAQSGGMPGSFSRIGFGPRGMAMGNALSSVTGEGIYSYYNPALAAQTSRGNQIDFSTAAMSFDRSFHTVNGTFRLPPSAGITLSVINANVEDIDARSIDGYDTGTLETHEYQIASALGVQLTSQFSAGIGLKYYIADYHTDLSTAQTVGLDLGALYRFSDQLQVGLSVQDLLASYNWDSSTLYGNDSSARTDDFPTQIHLGTSYSIISGLLICIEGGRMIHENNTHNLVKIGSSFDLHERVTIRAGWQIDDLSSPETTNHGSAGFSVHLPFDLLSPSIDYAFVQERNKISYMHTFGLRLNI